MKITEKIIKELLEEMLSFFESKGLDRNKKGGMKELFTNERLYMDFKDFLIKKAAYSICNNKSGFDISFYALMYLASDYVKKIYEEKNN